MTFTEENHISNDPNVLLEYLKTALGNNTKLFSAKSCHIAGIKLMGYDIIGSEGKITVIGNKWIGTLELSKMIEIIGEYSLKDIDKLVIDYRCGVANPFVYLNLPCQLPMKHEGDYYHVILTLCKAKKHETNKENSNDPSF